jgi:transposase
MHEMSTQVRHELDYVPAKIRMLEHVRYVYGCRRCEREGIEVPIRTTPAPKPVIERGLASASILAHVIDKKFVEAVPLYRQEQQFARQGIDLSRAVLSNWVIAASRWLAPLYERMKKELVARDILHADETTVQVLKEAGRVTESKSYMWLYRTNRDGPQIVLYEYQQTRGGVHPKEFLEGFQGYLQVDGYAGYLEVEGATLVGCWAHARRKFDEVLKGMAQKHRRGSQAEQALAYINKLFSIERELAECTPEQRLKGREEKSRPIVEDFKTWLDGIADNVLPKSLLGVAVKYCLKQWTRLVRFLEDGRLEISNNSAERSIKPFVIGRKNWMFANTPKGARSSALIYSVIETAKENKLSPYEYVKMLLEKLPNLPTLDGEYLEPLLPWKVSVKAANPAE